MQVGLGVGDGNPAVVVFDAVAGQNRRRRLLTWLKVGTSKPEKFSNCDAVVIGVNNGVEDVVEALDLIGVGWIGLLGFPVHGFDPCVSLLKGEWLTTTWRE